MQYTNVVQGRFVKRPNRFIAHVRIDGKEEIVHVKNTGRCRELLVPDAVVYLERSANPKRKTEYDLIAVEKNGRLINMDSQMPNAGAAEWIGAGGLGFVPAVLRREVKFGNSRFDFWYEKQDGRQGFVEVKGVTLEEENVVRFPDAPTQRGLKHIKELMDCVGAGYEAWALFVVQMCGVNFFAPNDDTMPAFGQQLTAAEAAGVKLLAVECAVSPEEVILTNPVPIRLGKT